jgi:integrase
MPCLARDKSGFYFIVSTVKGRRVWKSTHTKNHIEAYRKLIGKIDEDVKPTSPTLDWAIEEHLRHVKANQRDKTHRLYGMILHAFSKHAGPLALQAVTPLHLDRYVSHRLESVSASTVNVHIRSLRAFFNRLKRWKLLIESPCDGVPYVRVPQATPAYLSLEALRDFTRKQTDAWLKRIVVFVSMTGLRLGEVLNLQWNDVDVGRKAIIVRSNESFQVKGGKNRTVPLNETAVAVLGPAGKPEGYVFPGRRGGKAQDNYVSRTFRLAAREAGLDPKIHFHSHRHSFASLLVQRNVSLYQVKKLLGHSSPRVTEVYAHLQSCQMHDVVGQIVVP